MVYELNFISDNCTEKDVFHMFNEGDVIHKFKLTDTIAELLVHVGVFSSLTQARKNGWDWEIPWGFNEYRVGKKFLYIYKRRYSDAELDEMSKNYDESNLQ